MGETAKAHDRRKSEGWYEKYIDSPGIDIGCGIDPLPVSDFVPWDLFWTPGANDENLEKFPTGSFKTVYASHVLEHVSDPVSALRSWYRLVSPGGHLIVCVPHRDLYERKTTRPSYWNPEHLTFWLPDTSESPDTRSLYMTVTEACPEANLMSLRVLDTGYDHTLLQGVHPVGEYSIEVVLRKPL